MPSGSSWRGGIILNKILHSSRLTQRARRLAKRLIFSFDGFLIGYPKVGNTWMQVMLRHALVSHFDLPQESIRSVLGPNLRRPRGVPSIEVTHHMPGFHAETYRELRVDPRPLAGKRIVLLIRNPGDTLVSLYFHNAYRASPPVFTGTADRFARDDVYGIEKYITYYNQMYDAISLARSAIVIDYEKMLLDPGTALRTALTTLGVTDVSDSTIRRAVDFGSFQNMRAMEDSNALDLQILRPLPHAGEQGRKVRSARLEGFREHLSPSTISFIEERVDQGLTRELREHLYWPSFPEP